MGSVSTELVEFTLLQSGVYHVNVSVNETLNESIADVSGFVFIEDKRHENLDVLPGERFYVERTVNGSDGLDVVFVPLYSGDLIFDGIEDIQCVRRCIWQVLCLLQRIWDEHEQTGRPVHEINGRGKT